MSVRARLRTIHHRVTEATEKRQMPIKPENKSKYPKDWKAIRARILEREGNCCKLCFVKNHKTGFRWANGEFSMRTDRPKKFKLIKIVLTIAHLDQDPTNNVDHNLAALCQRCHNIIDMPQRQKNAAKTRAAKKAVI